MRIKLYKCGDLDLTYKVATSPLHFPYARLLVEHRGTTVATECTLTPFTTVPPHVRMLRTILRDNPGLVPYTDRDGRRLLIDAVPHASRKR